MGLFSSKLNVSNEGVFKSIVHTIGGLHYFFTEVEKEDFTKNTIEGVKFFGRFCYNFDEKFYYELGLANIKLNKEQKHNVKLACGLIRDSLWEPEMNEIKNCVEKFSDYHKQANGKLIAGSDHPIFKDSATKVFRKELAENGITFVD
tara:strand:+ start:1049 stop:1489 length:441 start_codon:yes stop_codon:yes gene_type:complete